MNATTTRTPIKSFKVAIGARALESGKPVDLIKMTSKRDRGPKEIPGHEDIDPVFDVDDLRLADDESAIIVAAATGSSGPSTPGATFNRMQFKNATSISARKSAAVYHHILVFAIIAELEDGRKVKIATMDSKPLVVRGRSPKHYREANMAASLEVTGPTLSSSPSMNNTRNVSGGGKATKLRASKRSSVGSASSLLGLGGSGGGQNPATAAVHGRDYAMEESGSEDDQDDEDVGDGQMTGDVFDRIITFDDKVGFPTAYNNMNQGVYGVPYMSSLNPSGMPPLSASSSSSTLISPVNNPSNIYFFQQQMGTMNEFASPSLISAIQLSDSQIATLQNEMINSTSPMLNSSSPMTPQIINPFETLVGLSNTSPMLVPVSASTAAAGMGNTTGGVAVGMTPQLQGSTGTGGGQYPPTTASNPATYCFQRRYSYLGLTNPINEPIPSSPTLLTPLDVSSMPDVNTYYQQSHAGYPHMMMTSLPPVAVFQQRVPRQ
ncbi:hypothetical protein HDU76_001685 [Blyttiomyces sp. JEL0837]|nr:hypothetical protein HDU76_001685 [Blyttiomyces sp. JEL0837]